VINRNEDQTTSDVFTRRARVQLAGDLGDWSYKASYNLTDGGSVYVLHASYKGFGKLARITLGQQKEYFGLEESGSSKWVTAIERSMPSNAFGGGKNVGIRLHGANDFLTYNIGIYRESIDANDGALDRAVTGRFVIRPFSGKRKLLHIGAGFSTRRGQFDALSARLGVRGGEDKTANEIEANYRGQNFASDSKAWNLETAAIWGRLHFMAEYFDAELSGAGTAPNIEANGNYFQVGWTLTGERRRYKSSVAAMSEIVPKGRGGAWEVFARVDNLDLTDTTIDSAIDIDGGQARSATFGLNWYASDSIKVALNAVRVETDLPFNGRDSGSAIVARVQFVF
jgi:phosphate-selective porin OprO/OprP